eukprot:m.341046 g.341046  ORF g.341046 m.341046 type:complete len:147 (+) comp19775_c0_seq1:192-632(+)
MMQDHVQGYNFQHDLINTVYQPSEQEESSSFSESLDSDSELDSASGEPDGSLYISDHLSGLSGQLSLLYSVALQVLPISSKSSEKDTRLRDAGAVCGRRCLKELKLDLRPDFGVSIVASSKGSPMASEIEVVLESDSRTVFLVTSL